MLLDKNIRDHMKELTSEVKDGHKTFKLYSTHLGALALLSDPMLENLSAVVNKQTSIPDLRYYTRPEWF